MLSAEQVSIVCKSCATNGAPNFFSSSMIKLMVFACFCRTAEDETRRAKEEKNKISKAVGAKKKADKKADISAEQE